MWSTILPPSSRHSVAVNNNKPQFIFEEESEMSGLSLEGWITVIGLSLLCTYVYWAAMRSEGQRLAQQEAENKLLDTERRTEEIRAIVREELEAAKSPTIASLNVY